MKSALCLEWRHISVEGLLHAPSSFPFKLDTKIPTRINELNNSSLHEHERYPEGTGPAPALEPDEERPGWWWGPPVLCWSGAKWTALWPPLLPWSGPRSPHSEGGSSGAGKVRGEETDFRVQGFIFTWSWCSITISYPCYLHATGPSKRAVKNTSSSGLLFSTLSLWHFNDCHSYEDCSFGSLIKLLRELFLPMYLQFQHKLFDLIGAQLAVLCCF